MDRPGASGGSSVGESDGNRYIIRTGFSARPVGAFGIDCTSGARISCALGGRVDRDYHRLVTRDDALAGPEADAYVVR
jgi:hypothetical protein